MLPCAEQPQDGKFGTRCKGPTTAGAIFQGGSNQVIYRPKLCSFISSVQPRRLRFIKPSDLLAFAGYMTGVIIPFHIILQISTPRYECEFVSCRIVLLSE